MNKCDLKCYFASNAGRVGFALKLGGWLRSSLVQFISVLKDCLLIIYNKGQICFVENTESRPDAHRNCSKRNPRSSDKSKLFLRLPGGSEDACANNPQ